MSIYYLYHLVGHIVPNPLDDGLLKAHYRNECNMYIKLFVGEEMAPYEAASLFRRAFCNVSSV